MYSLQPHLMLVIMIEPSNHIYLHLPRHWGQHWPSGFPTESRYGSENTLPTHLQFEIMYFYTSLAAKPMALVPFNLGTGLR